MAAKPRSSEIVRSITHISNANATQLCPDRVYGAKRKRGDRRGWIRSRAGRKHAATKNKKVLVVVRSAMLVDHRIGFVAHACGPHYMTRAEEIERLGIIIGLQLAASDTHCIEDSLMHLDDFLEQGRRQ